MWTGTAMGVTLKTTDFAKYRVFFTMNPHVVSQTSLNVNAYRCVTGRSGARVRNADAEFHQ